MEAIHQIINESVSGGFWHFAGYLIMTGAIFTAPIYALASVLESAIKKGAKQ